MFHRCPWAEVWSDRITTKGEHTDEFIGLFPLPPLPFVPTFCSQYIDGAFSIQLRLVFGFTDGDVQTLDNDAQILMAVVFAGQRSSIRTFSSDGSFPFVVPPVVGIWGTYTITAPPGHLNYRLLVATQGF